MLVVSALRAAKILPQILVTMVPIVPTLNNVGVGGPLSCVAPGI